VRPDKLLPLGRNIFPILYLIGLYLNSTFLSNLEALKDKLFQGKLFLRRAQYWVIFATICNYSKKHFWSHCSATTSVTEPANAAERGGKN
jgi:hypothetical protein